MIVVLADTSPLSYLNRIKRIVIEDATPSPEKFDVRCLVERSDDSLFGSVVARQGCPPLTPHRAEEHAAGPPPLRRRCAALTRASRFPGEGSYRSADAGVTGDLNPARRCRAVSTIWNARSLLRR